MVSSPNTDPSFQPNMMLHKAIQFGAVAHAGQFRKGTTVPYIVHPFEVAQILTAAGAEMPVICAGLLHDTVEDTQITIENITLEFGEDVAALVAGASEDKSKTWHERKQHTLDYLSSEATVRELMLACADKLSNMRSIAEDYSIVGDALWDRFNQGKDAQKWYYSGLTEALKRLQDYDMYREFVALYQQVFAEGSVRHG
ncbi:HD domain-containing protein [Paenibacillus marinisediminis]